MIGHARDIAEKYGSELISANIQHGFPVRAKFLFLGIGDIKCINDEVALLFPVNADVEITFKSVRVVTSKSDG